MTKVGERLLEAAHEARARAACWAACRNGERPEQAGETFTRCYDPRVCHGWREHAQRKEQ